MSAKEESFPRVETDSSLRAERQNTDHELARATVADVDADRVLQRARDRADRLLDAARAAADARLPLAEQTKAAVALVLGRREAEDEAIATERRQAHALVDQERREQREKLAGVLVLERQATDLHLALERSASDRAVEKREDFLAQASHDLRGLLAAHRLYLALLVKQSGDDESGRQLEANLVTLSQIGAQMERLTSDLVDVVAIEAGVLAVAPRPHSAAEILTTSTSVFGPLARERGQSLTVTATAADVRVMADAARAIQVIGNLISNAIKFTPAGGKIRVGLAATQDQVTFFVADTGPGVAAEHAERIFERFAGSSTAMGGLGLGLFISKRLVEAHGGRLWVDSNAEGGAVFRFALMRAPLAETQPDHSTSR